MSNNRVSRIPAVWCVVVALLLGSAFQTVRWSYVDLANNLAAAGDHRSWQVAIGDAFTKVAEYRPLIDLSTRLVFRSVGIDIGVYRGIVLLEFVLILVALIVVFRPVGSRQGLAAMLALSVAVGLHTSQILFLFVPLNAYATSMLMVLAAAVLVITPRLAAYEALLLPITVVAMLWLEIGILIVPLVVAAWLMKAPAVTWRGVVAALAGLAVYLAARWGVGPGVDGVASTDTGFGFAMLTREQIAAMFDGAPWQLWLYNVVATLLTVLASEPRTGVFRFVDLLMHGHVPSWLWLHVLSSLVTTALVLGALPTIRARPHRERVVAALGAVLALGGSALGFLYTRDRIGLPVGIGYAMLVYVAVNSLLDRQTSQRKTIVVRILVGLLAVAWSIRTVERYTQLRDVAWDYHHEWYRPEAVAAGLENPIVDRIRASALKRRPADPSADPRWTYVLFERKFDPLRQQP